MVQNDLTIPYRWTPGVGGIRKSSKEAKKRKARGLPLSLPRPTGARLQALPSTTSVRGEPLKCWGNKEEQQRSKEKEGHDKSTKFYYSSSHKSS